MFPSPPPRVLPDLEQGMVHILKGAATSAGDAVGTDLGKGRPDDTHILLAREGGIAVVEDNRLDRGRILTECRARTREGAWVLANEVRAFLLPNLVEGLHGKWTYTDANTQERVDIVLWGVRIDTDPTYDPDLRGIPRVRQAFMVSYY